MIKISCSSCIYFGNKDKMSADAIKICESFYDVKEYGLIGVCRESPCNITLVEDFYCSGCKKTRDCTKLI